MYVHAQPCLTLTPWTVTRQAPLAVGFPRQEYWSGLPFPPPVYLPDPGIELTSPVSPAMVGRFSPNVPLEKPLSISVDIHKIYILWE